MCDVSVMFTHPWPQQFNQLPTSTTQKQQRKYRGRSLQKVYPEVLQIIWEFAGDIESLFAMYGTCCAWRERVLSLKHWETYYGYVRDMKSACQPDEPIPAIRSPDDFLKLLNEGLEVCRYNYDTTTVLGFYRDNFLFYCAVKMLMPKDTKRRKAISCDYIDIIVAGYFTWNGTSHITDRTLALRCVRQCGLFLKHLSPTLQNDRDVVTAAVRNAGLSLEFASEELRGDREIVTHAVKNDGEALEDASDEILKSDRYIIEKAVKKSGMALRFAPVIWHHDRDIVIAAVRQNGLALQHLDADSPLHTDREVITTALKSNGKALVYVLDPSLRVDDEVCMLAMKNTGHVYPMLDLPKKIDPTYFHQLMSSGVKITTLSIFPYEILSDVPCWLDSIPNMQFCPARLFWSFRHQDNFFFNDPQGLVLSAFARRFPIDFYEVLSKALEDLVHKFPEFRTSFVANVIGEKEVGSIDRHVFQRFLALSSPGHKACYELFFDMSVFEHDVAFVREVIAKHPLAIQVLDRYLPSDDERLNAWVAGLNCASELHQRKKSEEKNVATPQRQHNHVVALACLLPEDMWKREPLHAMLKGVDEETGNLFPHELYKIIFQD
eukprot:PhF_6_TR11026/c0_g1_i2/m.17864